MNKEDIKKVAIEIIGEIGLINLSCGILCERIDMPPGSFPNAVGCKFTEFVEELKSEIDDNAINNHPVTKSRVDPDLRKQQILDVAVELSKEHGYHKITRDDIRRSAGVSAGVISQRFNTMKQLRRAVMRAAIHRKIPEIVAQGLANQDDNAKKAPPELKRQALELIANY